jgi:hypothetical protein
MTCSTATKQKVILQIYCSVITGINPALGMYRGGTTGMKIYIEICNSETEN